MTVIVDLMSLQSDGDAEVVREGRGEGGERRRGKREEGGKKGRKRRKEKTEGDIKKEEERIGERKW